MKILFLALDVNIDNKTGDAIHVRELAQSLAKLGNELDLVISSTTPSRQFKGANLRVHYNPNPKSMATIRFCKEIIKQHKPQVIYERRFSPKIGAYLSRRLGIPLIVEINGLVEKEARLQGTWKEKPVIGAFKRWMRKRFYQQTKKIVAVSKGIKSDLNKEYNIPLEKIIVIPNGANVDLFKPLNQSDCRKELDLDENKKYVCFIGNLAPWQGVENLIHAAPHVLRELPDTRFLIVGDGVMKNKLVEQSRNLKISDNVMFTGNMKYQDVPKAINASDVCISVKPPLLPGSPLKVREYMSCGKPVIASRGTEYDFEMVEDAKAGILVDPQDGQEITDAILYILKNPHEAHEMGIRGRELIIRDYSWLNVAKKIQNICNSAV
jgi:glycosyltransferase involved in cell wall biosynthesis